MSTRTAESTIAAELAASPAVEEAIQTIIRELREHQASITGVRPPAGELRETYQQWLKRQEAVKGRAPLYPYVGSGIGNGPLVELLDGSVKWDLINGIGVHMFGHSHPDLVAAAIRASLGDTIMQGNLQFNADAIEFGEFLIREASKGSNLRHAFLINGGAMANESALKVCMQKKDGKANRILAFTDCFMGRSTTMAQIGDGPAYRVGVPLNTLVDYMPFFDPDNPDASIRHATWQLEQYLHRYPGQHCCFVFELVQGEGGFNTAPREFFLPLLELCRKHGVPIWFDEIQTFGRTTQMFAYDMLGLGQYVDVLTLGKMSQVCACMFTAEFNPQPGLLSATFLGSTISLQVGMTILETLRDGGYYGPNGRIAKLHEAFRAHADALVRKHADWFPPIPNAMNGEHAVRGRGATVGGVGGLMRFTPFAGEKKKIIDACHRMFEEGVIAFYCGHGPYSLRFLPPIGVMEPRHFDDVFPIVERALDRVARGA
jgi:4-aminobutyrate aminotransferase-like enzyme